MGKKGLRLILAVVIATVTALMANVSPAQASGYYRIQTRLPYGGNSLCLQANGRDRAVTLATCSTSSRQKWAYYTLYGRAVLANVGYSPALALDAPSISGGTTVETRGIMGNDHQGWLWDSLYNRNGNIYLQSNSGLVLQPTSVTPGAVVKIQPYSGFTGIQSWSMRTW